MRYSRTALTTLLAAGLTLLAAGPAASAKSFSAQEKPKASSEARADRQEMPREHEKAQKADQRNDKHQAMKEDKKDKQQAKEEKKDAKNAGGEHGRVPEKTYKSHFGEQHKVKASRIITTTHIVPNQTRFVYTGYTFVFLQPWPMGWGFDDDVYIAYMGDGWYMFDPFHPGVQLGLSIVM